MRTITLNSGFAVPQIGLGLYQVPDGTARDVVLRALDAGYRHFDTAAAYGNEHGVGNALAATGVPRSEITVETKIWVTDYGYEQTLRAGTRALERLRVEQIDLVLLHHPLPSAFDRTLEAYRALEALQAEGVVRAIGVSNFSTTHLERLLDRSAVVPAVNQIECHPYFQQADVQALGREHGIATQAWSPIGGVTFYPGWRGNGHPSTLNDPTIAKIAERHGRSPAQVLLRWGAQHGRSLIPKSTDPARMAENLAVFDFALDPEEMAAIDALETGRRGGPDPEDITA